LQPRVIILNTIIRDMERMLEPLIGEDVELVVELDPGLGPVKADPGQIEQVIMNLAVNARDAMPGGGRLTLATRNATVDATGAAGEAGLEPGAYVVLSVADTGTGLSPEVMPHLFEPFFTTKEEGKGTGLGLATVYGIVKQSGGHISPRTRAGRGTIFSVYLPRLEEEAAALEEVESTDRTVNGTESILLVEDNQSVRELARKVLENGGYRVAAARLPAAALALAANAALAIDLLVTDMVMPGMNGRELSERICALRPGAKVLLVSGYIDNAFLPADGLGAGTAFLQKPFTPHGLLRAVRDVLDG
jgi:two-component system, cell cycle sensor histidine kinase and response regulator CckA